MSEKISDLARAILANLPTGALFVGLRGYRSQPNRKWAARATTDGRTIFETLVRVRADPLFIPVLSDKAREEFDAFRALLTSTTTDAEIHDMVANGVEATGEVQDVVMAIHVSYGRLRQRDAAILRRLTSSDEAAYAVGRSNVEAAAKLLEIPERLAKRALMGNPAISPPHVRKAAEDILLEKDGDRERAASVDAREENMMPLLDAAGLRVPGVRFHVPSGHVRLVGLVARKTVTTPSNVPSIPTHWQNEVTRAAHVVRRLLPSSLWREYRLVKGNFETLTTDGVTVEDRHFSDDLAR